MSRKGLNIYKRKDGRWEARYIKSRTAQGKPLYGYLYASSYHEARNRLQDVIRLQGNAPNSKEMSKGSVFEFFSIEWLDTFSTSFKESTYIRYRTLIRCYLMPYFQTAKIESITKEHVLDFCKEIETHGKRDGTALSTKTVSDILSVLRRILHYAKAQNIPVDSAIFDIRIKQTPKPLPVLSLSEQLTLQKYLIGHPDCLNLGILLCLFTGIRIGELCALTWDKISLSERNLCICQTMQRIQTRIEPEYDKAKSFSGGVAAVCTDGKWGFINGNGTLVIDHLLADASYFDANGVCPARVLDSDVQQMLSWRVERS